MIIYNGCNSKPWNRPCKFKIIIIIITSNSLLEQRDSLEGAKILKKAPEGTGWYLLIMLKLLQSYHKLSSVMTGAICYYYTRMYTTIHMAETCISTRQPLPTKVMWHSHRSLIDTTNTWRNANWRWENVCMCEYVCVCVCAEWMWGAWACEAVASWAKRGCHDGSPVPNSLWT